MGKGLTIKLSGVDLLKSKLNSFSIRKKKAIMDLVSETALNIETEAKKNVPVDTGRLKSSIRILAKAISGLGVEVGTEVDYAAKVEYTNKAYLNPAAESERRKYDKKLKNILKNK